MKQTSPRAALRRLAPVLAACALVFGTQAAEVADAGARRTPAPRRAAPSPRPAEAVRETIPASHALGQVSGESVNFRLGPGMNHAVAGSLRAGEYVKARSKQNGWLEIDWPKNVPAWIEKSDVNVSRRGSETMGLIADRSARIYSVGNTKSSVLATLSKGAPVEIVGEQGSWYKIKAPAGASAYISARYVVTGLTAPAKASAPVAPAPQPAPARNSTPVETVAARKTDAPADAQRAIPQVTPVAPPPLSKAVLPAPTAPAAVAPEEPSAALTAKPEEKPLQKSLPIEDQKPHDVVAPAAAKPLANPVADPSAAESAMPADAVAHADDTADALPPLDALVPVPSIRAILDEYEALPAPEALNAPQESSALTPAADPAQELKQALDALRAPVDSPAVAAPAPAAVTPDAPAAVQNELAKAIEETRQSLRQEEPQRSVIDDSLQALETARLAAEARRRAEEEKQRASLSAALKQFEAMETRRRAEPEQPIDLGIDARTGIFLAPPEPAQPSPDLPTGKAAKLPDSLLEAFESDQARLALEREQSAFTDAIRRSEEWRAFDIEDIARRDEGALEIEQNAVLAALLAEDAQRLQAESESAQSLKKQIEALDLARTAAPLQTPRDIRALKPLSAEQDILQALENARRALQTSAPRAETIEPETILPAPAAETAKARLAAPAPAVLPAPDENKYGHFLDPNETPAPAEPRAKSPAEELRSLMFPAESSEPASSKLPDIGRGANTAVLRVELVESAKAVELEAPPAQPVSAKAPKEELPSIHDVRGIEVIPEPEGTIHEDMFRETNKRVKSKFVVPGNAPAPLGRRAEVISLDE